jgi:hypothetical protein
LTIQENFTVRKLNKNKKFIVDYYQKSLIKYIDLCIELQKYNINKVEQLVKEDKLLEDIYKDKDVFQCIFDFIFHDEYYEINYQNKTISFLLDGLKKNKSFKILQCKLL